MCQKNIKRLCPTATVIPSTVDGSPNLFGRSLDCARDDNNFVKSGRTYADFYTPRTTDTYTLRPAACPRDPEKGFTLIEILIALFVFTIVATIMSITLHNIIRFESHTFSTSRTFADTQITLLLLSRDTSQIVPRPLADYKNEVFHGNKNEFIFTHTGVNLQRTGYSFNQGKLNRLTWDYPDMPKTVTPNNKTLLRNINQLSFCYLDKNNKFHSGWPPPGENISSLPKAIQINLRITGIGKIKQLYLISGTQTDDKTPT